MPENATSASSRGHQPWRLRGPSSRRAPAPTLSPPLDSHGRVHHPGSLGLLWNGWERRIGVRRRAWLAGVDGAAAPALRTGTGDPPLSRAPSDLKQAAQIRSSEGVRRVVHRGPVDRLPNACVSGFTRTVVHRVVLASAVTQSAARFAMRP